MEDLGVSVDVHKEGPLAVEADEVKEQLLGLFDSWRLSVPLHATSRTVLPEGGIPDHEVCQNTTFVKFEETTKKQYRS